MAGYIYASTFAATANAAAADIWEVTAPSDATVIIHGFSVYQTTDLGDAFEEVLALTAARSTGSTSGSGGQSVTTTAIAKGTPAFGGTVEGLNTTQVTGGTTTVGERWGWNIRIPLLVIYTPEMRPMVSPSDRWVLAMPAPADSITIGATVWYEEFGG